MFKCVKIQDSGIRDLEGSTNRERRGVVEADTTYVDPSAVGVDNENSDEVLAICTYALTHGLCYVMHVRRNRFLADICNEYAHQKFSAHLKYDVWRIFWLFDTSEHSGPTKNDFFWVFRRLVRPSYVQNNKNPSKCLIKMTFLFLEVVIVFSGCLCHFFKSFNKEVLWIFVLA